MKKTAKKLRSPPHRILREFTPQERERWRKAVAEETSPEAVARAQRAMRGVERGRAALRAAFKLLRQERERQGLSLSDMQSRTDNRSLDVVRPGKRRGAEPDDRHAVSRRRKRSAWSSKSGSWPKKEPTTSRR